MMEQRQTLRIPLVVHGGSGIRLKMLVRYDGTDDAWRSENFPTLVDTYRTLWTAGWNARYTQYYLGVPPKVTWSPGAEDIIAREYHRLHFPSHCGDARGKTERENGRV